MSQLRCITRFSRSVVKSSLLPVVNVRVQPNYTAISHNLHKSIINHNISTQQIFRCFASDASATAQLDSKEITERVLEVVKKFPKVDQSKVTPTAVFSSDLGLDSLDAVELVMELEEEFKIEINDQDADKITSVKDAIDHISKNTDAR